VKWTIQRVLSRGREKSATNELSFSFRLLQHRESPSSLDSISGHSLCIVADALNSCFMNQPAGARSTN
jgi:hypothetical protein